MTWTTPRTWVPDFIVRAADLNEQLRDNLLALRAESVPKKGFTTAAGTGQGLTDGFSVDTGGGQIDMLFTPAIGHRIRLNDDTTKGGGGKVIGIRYQRNRVNMWDLDIESNSGKFIIDDLSVQPSQGALTCEPGQLSPGINIGPSVVKMQRQLDLVDLATGASGVREQYSTSEGVNWIDRSRMKNVTQKQLTSNVATLTTSVAHGFAVGEVVLVESVDATFNGEHAITAVPSTTTFSYNKTAADVAATAVTGGLAGPTSRIFNFVLGTAGRAFFTTPGGVEISGGTAGSTGLRLTNTVGNKTWRLGAILEGVSNDSFTIRNVTAGRDAVRIDQDGTVVIGRDLLLVNPASSHQWRAAAVEEGVSNSRFTIRDVTGSKDLLRLDGAGNSVAVLTSVGMRALEVGALDSAGVGFRTVRVTN